MDYQTPHPSLSRGFIRGVEQLQFNGGMGSTGLPVLFFWGPQLLMLIVFTGVMLAGYFYFGRKQRQSDNNILREAVHLGTSARQEGLSAEQFNTRVENFHQALPFYRRPGKDRLIACAQAAFEGDKQNPT